jgi:hypothetical protein
MAFMMYVIVWAARDKHVKSAVAKGKAATRQLSRTISRRQNAEDEQHKDGHASTSTQADEFHRCLLGVFQICFQPMSLAAIDVLIRRCYSTTEDSECEDLSFFPSGDETSQSQWLLKADTGVIYLGSSEHVIAWIVAIAVLVLSCAVLPLYIFRGAQRETRSMGIQHSVLQKHLAHAKHSFMANSHDSIGSQLHVRHVGGDASEEALRPVFEQFGGQMLQATIRKRVDESGNDTSWALVTMRKPAEAQKVIAEADNLVPLTVALYDILQAGQSTGDMPKVKRLAASKQEGRESKQLDENAQIQIRTHLVGRSGLRFSPVYGKFNANVMSWWFAVDLTKKLLVNVVFAIGQDKEHSMWKFHVFLIIGASIVMHTVYNPSPGRTSNLFEMSASIMILIVLYTSSISDFRQENTLQAILAFLLGLMVLLVGCVKAWSDKARIMDFMSRCLVCMAAATNVVQQQRAAGMNPARGEKARRESAELNETDGGAAADLEVAEEHQGDEFESILPVPARGLPELAPRPGSARDDNVFAVPSADPESISGLWRSVGITNGVEEEEFLQLNVAPDGSVTGMIDSDGDGVWSADDCKVERGSFDARTGVLEFDQAYTAGDLDEFDTTSWKCRYDQTTDSLVEGEWSVAFSVAGTFRMQRSTEEEMTKRGEAP